MSEPPQPDRREGAPHPRATPRVFGHEPAVEALLAAHGSGRMPHAWLLAGPAGIGKASLAYRAAAMLLSVRGEASLAMDPGDPVHRAVAEGNEPRLLRLIRTLPERGKTLRTAIAVDDVRAVKAALTFADPEDRWRAVIVDAAEEMNVSAANALLKVLEEPPERVAFFLVSHAPGRLLPTIRSRCRRVDLGALEEGDAARAFEQAMGEPPDPAILTAARGSVGEAVELAATGGAALRETLARVLAPLPARFDRAALHALADSAGAAGQNAAFSAASRLLGDLAARLATHAAGADAPPAGFEALAGAGRAADWAEAALSIGETSARALALNLDRRMALLDMVGRIETAARGGR